MNHFTSLFDSYLAIISGAYRQFLPWFKIGSAVISALLIWGIIHSIRGSRLVAHQTERLMDRFNIKLVARRRAIEAWQRVTERFQRGTETNYKLAILEADKILDEILKLIGFAGETADERLAQVTAETMSGIENIRQSHQIANRIARDPEFTVDADLARETIKAYRDLFSEYGIT